MLRYSSVKFDNLICLEKNIPVLITIGSLLSTLDTQIYMVILDTWPKQQDMI